MITRHSITTLCIVISFTGLANAQRFELAVPGDPGLRSTAVLDGRHLIITDVQGESFRYQRVPQFDTRDGRYLGFSSANARQAIRWPADGRGVMQIGDLNGANWRPSQMLIRRVAPRRQAVARATRAPGRTYVAAVESGRNRTAVGYIDPEGNVQLFEGRGRIWKHRPIARVDGLVPGAPLAMALDPHSPTPLIYSVGWDGGLLEISDGRRVRAIAPELRFIPRTVLRLIDRGRSLQLFAVDRTGAIWNVDPTPGSRPEAVEPRTERYDAGVPLFLVPGATDQLFLVDRGGALVSYSREGGRWLGPQLVDRGFVSGAHIAGALYNNVQDVPGAHVAAVDADGRIALYTETLGRWSRSPAPSAPFPPSAPLTFAASLDSVRLVLVNHIGDWDECVSIGGDWSVEPLIEGFSAGAPVAVTPSGNEAFALDRLGRLVAATRRANAWELALVVPGADRVPRLVRRSIRGVQVLPPAKVVFENRSDEDIVYRIDDLADPQTRVERRLSAGATAIETLSRDSGAVLEEVYAIPLPDGTWVEEVNRLDLNPQPRQIVTVFFERTTYRYIDRRKDKPAGAIPNFDRKSLVSLGVFPLPPGELLQDGSRWDVVGEASAARNPGAAAFSGAPPLLRDREQQQ